MSNITKIIDILDPQTQTVKETVIERQPEKTELLQEALRNFNSTVLGKTGYSTFAEADRDGFKKIREAAATTSDFPTLLRTGLKQILFASYDEEPETYTQWVYQEPSDKQAEDWVEMNRLGTAPVVSEGQPYPEVTPALDRSVRIANQKRGFIFAITREMLKFDKSNQMNFCLPCQ